MTTGKQAEALKELLRFIEANPETDFAGLGRPCRADAMSGGDDVCVICRQTGVCLDRAVRAARAALRIRPREIERCAS